jgi:hypothetical protein
MTPKNALGSHRKEFREADKPPWSDFHGNDNAI